LDKEFRETKAIIMRATITGADLCRGLKAADVAGVDDVATPLEILPSIPKTTNLAIDVEGVGLGCLRAGYP
jgi:hypothetical protein